MSRSSITSSLFDFLLIDRKGVRQRYLAYAYGLYSDPQNSGSVTVVETQNVVLKVRPKCYPHAYAHQYDLLLAYKF